MAPVPLPHIDLPADLRSLLPRHISSSLANLAASNDLSKRSLSTSTDPISSLPSLTRRQQLFYLIPPSYPRDDIAPGAVAGIVLGSVAGFLLIIILIYSLAGGTLGGGGGGGRSITGDEEVVIRRRDRSPHRSRHSRHSRSVREVSRSPRRPSRTIVEERVERVRERTPPPPMPRSSGGIIVERIETSRPPHHRRVDGDDIVEVIEEQSVSSEPPRRHRSRRSSGYRQVFPEQYAGGNYPQHLVRTRSRRHS